MADLTNINSTFLASTIHLSLFTALYGIQCTVAVAHTLYSIVIHFRIFALMRHGSFCAVENIFLFQLSMSLCPLGILYLYSLLQSADATTGSALLLPKVPGCLIFRCIRHKVKLKIPVTEEIYFKHLLPIKFCKLPFFISLLTTFFLIDLCHRTCTLS
jgi:hypothetical protein